MKNAIYIIIITNIFFIWQPYKLNAQNEKLVTVINCCSFTLPDDLEVQSGSWKKFNDNIAKKIGKEYQSDKLWLQQIGLNKYEKEAYNHYVRMSFSITELEENSFLNPTEKPDLSVDDLNYMDSIYDITIKNYKLTKILSIEKSVICKIGKYYSIKKVFTSKMEDKPTKKTIKHIIYGNYKIYYVEIEYWVSDYEKYKEAINAVINTMKLL